jgi:MoaA/NifB/PqqE/SkfB family radical SAM enzyme
MGDSDNFMNLAYPDNINILTTYHCNSMCTNCSIWKRTDAHQGKRELGAEELERLCSDPIFSGCQSFGLAGGEPTISPFFWELLHRLPKDSKVHISTNALKSERLIQFLAAAEDKGRYEIQVSIDGIGQTNDSIRGVPGAFEKSIRLLRKLEELEINRVVSFTINRINYHQLKECYDLAVRHGADFSTRIAQLGGAYRNMESSALFEFGEEELNTLDNSFKEIVFAELEKPNHFPPNLVYMSKIVDYYRGKQESLPCSAFESAVVIDLYGDVFPKCPRFMLKGIGNLHNQTLSEIWKSPDAEKMRKKIKNFQCGGCWNDCQMISNIGLNRDFLEREYSEIKIAFLREKGFPNTIDFTQGEDRLLIAGWHELEGNASFRFRWTGQEFSFLLPAGTNAIQLFARGADVPGLGTSLMTDLMIGGRKVGSISFQGVDWRDYTIQLPRSLDRETLCKLRANGCFCPKEAGVSEDCRNLGIAINRISFL